MQKIVKILAHPLMFILGISVIIVFLLGILPGESEKASEYTPEGKSFDTSLFYRADSVYERIASYGDDGRSSYIHDRWTFDLIFPLAYGFFCLTAAAFGLFRLVKPGSKFFLLLLLPLLAVLFDLGENTFVTILMVNYPREFVFLPAAASAATLIKWIFVTLSMLQAVLLPAAAGVKFLIVQRTRRSK
jgi:hypothetical protein